MRMVGKVRPVPTCCDDCDDSPSYRWWRKRMNKRKEQREWKKREEKADE